MGRGRESQDCRIVQPGDSSDQSQSLLSVGRPRGNEHKLKQGQFLISFKKKKKKDFFGFLDFVFLDFLTTSAF